jgi:uracil-DNA glycosylase
MAVEQAGLAGESNMRMKQCLSCAGIPCADVRHECFAVPDIELAPDKVQLVLVSEAAPASPSDYYYAGSGALFALTTIQAFNDAGVAVVSIDDILALGIYLTTAVKCAKTEYAVSTGTIKECSLLLEQELAHFPEMKAILLMGDVAIKAVNYIAQRNGEPRVVPAGSTYKIRGGDFRFRGARAFPSYLQAGPSYFIEKSKRRMIAQDIAAALAFARPQPGDSRS